MSEEKDLEKKEDSLAAEITDADIEEMSVEELAKTVERPKKTAAEKSAAEAKKKQNKKFNQSPAKRFFKKYKGLIIFLILLIIGIIAFLLYKKKNDEKTALENMTTPEFALIEKQDIKDTISTTGTIVSPKTSQLYSALKDTKLTNVYYEVGDHVNEGDVLVTFSTENIEKNINNAEEDIATSKKKEALDAENRERTYINSFGSESYSLQSKSEAVETKLKALYEACDAYGDAKRDLEDAKNRRGDYENLKDENSQSVISGLDSKVSTAYQQEQAAQTAYSDAVAALAEANRSTANNLASAEYQKESGNLTAGDSTKQLERQLENYQDSLDDYIVTAPISGIVTKVEVEEGNGFSGGNLMTIQRDDVLDITTEIDEYDIPYVKEGQKVVIKTDATQDDELEGIVTDIAPTATTSSGSGTGQSSSSGVTYTVKIEIKTKDDRLRLGMSAKINIITEERDDIFVVRYDAIEEDENGDHYIRVVDNSAPKMPSAAGDEATSDNKGSDNGISVVGVDGVPTGAPNGASGDGKSFGSKPNSGDMPASNEPATKKIYVEIGIEGDYYTQIISDEISEGMQVLVTSDFSSENNDPFAMMMGGGGGGRPSGGGGPR